MAGKYRKKPVVVEAMRFLGGEQSAALIANWTVAGGQFTSWRAEQTEMRAPNGELSRLAVPEHIRIRTLEGVMQASVGDFIIRGVQGEFYPCKPDIFDATYEAV